MAPTRLLDQDRQRERRNQQLLQERLSRAAERNIAQEIGDTMTALADEFANTGALSEQPSHQQRMDALMKRIWRASIEQMGERINQAIKYRPDHLTRKQDEFELFTEEFIQLFGAEKIQQVSRTTIEQVRRQISMGREEGLGQKEIADNIRANSAILSGHRSAVIARTETHSAGNYGAKKAADRSGVQAQREWIAAAQPSRTRDTHLDADGQTVGKDEPFSVGGHSLMYPGDPAGPAEETVNCRCAVGYVVAD